MNKSHQFLLLAVVLCLAAPVSLFAQQTVIDKIVAVVGKEPIFLSDLNSQVELYAFNNKIDASNPTLKQQILEAMINEKLMLAKAQDDTNISISEDQVTNQLDALIQQNVSKFGSEKKLEEVYGMPITKLKREFRDETRNQLMVQALQQEKFGDLRPTRREVEDFFRQYKDSLPNVPEQLELYYIFRVPKVSSDMKNRVREKLQLILDSIKAGGDFADFARRYSEDKGTASSGGDLGYVRRGEFFTEFEEAVFALKVNEISGIVETPLGFHIIQLLDRRGEQVHPRHILLKFREDPSEADSTIAFLKRLKDSAQHGSDFSELAKTYSDDKQSAQIGGFLGELPVTQFDKSIIDATAGLHDGEISDPIAMTGGKTAGYEILYLKKRTKEHQMQLPEDWKQVEDLATSYKRTTEYQAWLKQLRSEVYWESRL
ncbi:MAG TPA: peptidylprolyl isomerase [Bacteroidota bacterium]|nr:peptidylprolyl isomerase [Bacteroidota bacterium]